MEGQSFQIQILSDHMSAREWKRAMNAPESELELNAVLPLNEEQKEVAKKFEMSEEQYARAELARIYGQRGLQERAQRLGVIVEKMLSEVSPESQLVRVRYEGTEFRWVFGIQTPHGTRNISASRDLIDDVLDSELFEEIQRLKTHLKNNLGFEKASGS